MEPAALIIVQSSTGAKSWLLPLSTRAADSLVEALTRSRGLMPGEVASNLGAVFGSIEGAQVLEVPMGGPLPIAEAPPPPDPAVDPNLVVTDPGLAQDPNLAPDAPVTTTEPVATDPA